MRLFLLDTLCLFLSWRLYRLLFVGCRLTFSLGVIAGLDFALSWGWSICFRELLEMFSLLVCFVVFHDVLYSASMTYHF